MHDDRDLARSQVVATSGWQGTNDGGWIRLHRSSDASERLVEVRRESVGGGDDA